VAAVIGARDGAAPLIRDALIDPALAYVEHAAELRTYLLRCTRDAGTAEDLTQEAFLRLCGEVQAGRAPDNVRAWLYRVARNLAASRGRHLVVVRRWLDGQARDEPLVDAPERLALLHDREDRLETALDALPDPTRRALLMAASGYSGREIAGRISRSEVATRTLLCRGRSRLRVLLADEIHVGSSSAPSAGPGPMRPRTGAGPGSARPRAHATIGP
jgi:RNA polymerase sigma factor (sigma-70 family)